MPYPASGYACSVTLRNLPGHFNYHNSSYILQLLSLLVTVIAIPIHMLPTQSAVCVCGGGVCVCGCAHELVHEEIEMMVQRVWSSLVKHAGTLQEKDYSEN
jgi:hypothetical protein